MNGQRQFRLVSSRNEPDCATGRSADYRIFATNEADGDLLLRVYDRRRQRVLGSWRGAVARRLIETEVLGYRCLSCPAEACDKRFVQELMLVAAAIQMDFECRPTAEARGNALGNRLGELKIKLPPFHERIASLLFAHSGQHLSNTEIHCLTQLQYPFSDGEQIVSVLDDLVRWRVIQRIDVDTDCVFYDTDTTPHLHVFSTSTGELHDAPAAGVLRVAGHSVRAGGRAAQVAAFSSRDSTS